MKEASQALIQEVRLAEKLFAERRPLRKNRDEKGKTRDETSRNGRFYPKSSYLGKISSNLCFVWIFRLAADYYLFYLLALCCYLLEVSGSLCAFDCTYFPLHNTWWGVVWYILYFFFCILLVL